MMNQNLSMKKRCNIDTDVDITYVSFILTHAMTLHCVASAVIQKTENIKIKFHFKRGLRIAIIAIVRFRWLEAASGTVCRQTSPQLQRCFFRLKTFLFS